MQINRELRSMGSILELLHLSTSRNSTCYPNVAKSNIRFHAKPITFMLILTESSSSYIFSLTNVHYSYAGDSLST